MPRKRFWRRGITKKGTSHPSNKDCTIDDDQVKPPVKKVSETTRLNLLNKKGLRDGLGTPPSKVHTSNCSESCPESCSESCQKSCSESCQKSCFESCQKSCSDTLPEKHSGRFEKITFGSSTSTVFASHNQADSRYSFFSRGSQCTCMSLAAILSLFENCELTSSYLDRLLRNGDNLYKKVVMNLKNEGKFKHKLLSFDELPVYVEVCNQNFHLIKHTVIYGLLIMEVSTQDVVVLSLHDAVVRAFSKSSYSLIMIGGICSALCRLEEKYVFFDSHSHGPDGLSSPGGKAVLKLFDTLDDLISFLYAFYTSACIDFSSQFEVLPVDIEKIEHSFPDFDPCQRPRVRSSILLPSSFKENSIEFDEVDDTASMHNKFDKKRYMKSYMRKKRLNDQYRKTELAAKQKARENEEFRQKEFGSRQKAREDEEYRKKEANAKRMARENEEYRIPERQKELAIKQKAREDEEFRQKEFSSKQKARKDEEFRKKEANTKRMARENEEYRITERQKELAIKQKARKDKEFRQKELACKQNARKDEEFRQRELASKQKAREDEEFRKKEANTKRMARENEEYRVSERQKEQAIKQKARKDEEFRQKELASKQKAREDEEFRKKEVNTKRMARENEEYRVSERQKQLANKRKARECEEFRQKELASKQKARGNKQFRKKESEKKRILRQNIQYRNVEKQKELELKRTARESALFVEGERLRKQQKRRDQVEHAQEQESDRVRKAMKRKTDLYSENELTAATKRKYGSSIQECINRFQTSISTGPAFVCTCCHQTWFSESVTRITNDLRNSHPEMLTGYTSEQGREWICRTCSASLKKGKVPKLSMYNGMKWPSKPPELNLHPLEERLVSLRIPFMQIRELPRGGQYCVKGNVVNVPVDIQPTINALPREMDENFTVPVKLKKKLAYKKCDFTENVRPAVVLSAVHWLMNYSSMYMNSGVNIDETWIQRVNEDANDIVKEFRESLSERGSSDEEMDFSCENSKDATQVDEGISNDSEVAKIQQDGEDSDNFSEADANDNVVGNSDTLLEDVPVNTDRSYTFAPGEGQHPLSLYADEDAEYLSFPTIFCGQKRPENKNREVPVHYSDIAKWELRSVDRRAAQSVPNIFFKLKKIQLKQISDKVQLAVRRCKTKGKKITAAEARDQSNLDRIVRLDEGYYIFRQLRNSPAYLAARKKDVFAMIRQLGLPTWFMSLSSADTRWSDLLKILAKLNSGVDYTDEEIQNLSWMDKTKLIQKDPVTSSRFFDHRVQQFINIVLKSHHEPIGKITDFFYRVEFQQRGSPHIHMLVWVETSPKYQKNTEKEIEAYVDKYTTCSKDNEATKELVSMQTHKHSKTCRKKGKAVCRFGFPLPPLRKTMLLEPLDEDVDKYKKMYDKMQEKINNYKEGLDISFDEFLSDVVKMTETEYVKCIRSSLCGPKIFLKREPAEMRINLYNEDLLLAWNANLDLQFVLDPYACAMYIVSYISKSQRGMSALLDRACKEARQGNMDIKKQVRHIGNKFLNSVEVSAQEACYLVLQMPLTRSSRDVVFINTSPLHERILLLKQQSKLEELSPDSTDVHCQNIIERYAKRPKQLQNWCLADYTSQLEIKYPKSEDETCTVNEVNDDDLNFDAEQESDEEEFSSEDILVKLKNGIVIRKRMHDLILRYVHYSLKTDQENHYREKLLLFLPWRDELVDLLNGYTSYKLHYEQVHHIIDHKARHYERNMEEIEQALHAAEEESEQFDELAPNAQQANAEDELEGQQESDEYVHYNPDRPIEQRQYDISSDVGASTSAPTIECLSERVPDEQYLKLLRSLNKKQREFFNHVLHWVKTKAEPIYAFLSGGAGVGKSVLIKAIYQALHRHLHSTEGEDPDDVRILLCAFTGKAAYNINGVTIASAFRKKYNQLNQSMSSDELNTFRMKYRNLSVVIVDEVSMVGNKMLNFIDTRLKELTATNRPFGGISIIAVGDLYQLQPVGDSWIFNDLSEGAQILAPNLWKDHFSMFEMTQIMRQKDDLYFANLLNRLRTNDLTEDDKTEVQNHVISSADPNYPRDVPHLFIENKFVDSFNTEFINNISTSKVTVESYDTIIADIPKASKERLLKNLPKDASKTANLPHSLTLAVGMIYDVTVNLNVNDGLANGSTCIVKYVENRISQTKRPSIVWVLFSDTTIGSSTRQKYKHLYHTAIDPSWTPLFDVNRNFMYNHKSYQRTQFPLKPAAAKTIHKALGSTVEKLVIDLSQTRTRKTPHIHYVAMSRVRKFEHLKILNFNQDALAVDERVKEEMKRLREDAIMKLCFVPLYTIESNRFKLAMNNARSLHKHFHDVSKEPNILAASLIGIMESRLCSVDNDVTYQIEDFQILRCDQQVPVSIRRPSHGLVVYIKQDLECKRVVKHSTDKLEFLLCDVIHSAVGYIQVVVVYKSPSCSLEQFKEKVMNYLFPHLDLRKPFVIMGDFNFDILSGNSDFLRFMSETFHCSQHVTKATTNMGSALDLIFSNCSVISTETIESYWSDHKIVTGYI